MNVSSRVHRGRDQSKGRVEDRVLVNRAKVKIMDLDPGHSRLGLILFTRLSREICQKISNSCPKIKKENYFLEILGKGVVFQDNQVNFLVQDRVLTFRDSPVTCLPVGRISPEDLVNFPADKMARGPHLKD